jgi:antirestriction protein ArdC
MNTHPSIYDTVTDIILHELEEGTAPWVKPWTTGDPQDLPYNLVSQRQYSGVNIMLLWLSSLEQGFRSAGWLTFRQATELGGHVKKGSKGTHIVYASTFTKKVTNPETEEEGEEKIPFLKGYVVFNLAQTEGLPERLYRALQVTPLEDALASVEAFIQAIGAEIRHGGNRAFYQPTFDFVQLPDPGQFEGAPHYYATSLHEHGHWTGHKSRLNRDLTGRFGDAAYAAEELVAELTAAFLCAHLSIPGRLRHAEYIGNWITLLSHDKKAIFTASAKATAAAEYLRAFSEPPDSQPGAGEDGP